MCACQQLAGGCFAVSKQRPNRKGKTVIKLGMIGLGGMGRHHAGVMKGLDNVQIVGVCDLIEERATQVSETVGAPWTLDYRELLAKDIDAVWICTEPFNRREIVIAAAAAGKDIFTEKPVCLDLADADAMIAAARDANVKYMLGYVLRYTEPYRTLHRTLASGELGDLVSCWTRRFMPCDMSASWYGQQETSGGVTLDFGSHDCDWLCWLGGRAKSVFANVARMRPTVNADEHGQIAMRFVDGGMGSLEVSWWGPLSESSIGVVGTKGAMIVGRDGEVRKKVAGGEEEIVDIQSAMDVDPAGRTGARDHQGHIQNVANRRETIQQHFLRCIEEDLQPLTDAATGRHVLAVMAAAQLSAQRGASVELSEIDR
jgi:UDP-N-acetylglucosamine 3-dehydrogenase